MDLGNAIQILYGAVAAIAVLLAVVQLNNRDARGIGPLAVTTLGVALWAFSMLMQTAVDQAGYVQFHRLMHAGILVTTTGFFVFALEYTGRERYVTRRTLGLLTALAVAGMAAIVINPGGLFLGDLAATSTVIGYEYAWAPLLPLYFLYGYALVVGGAVLILAFLFRTDRTLYQGQAVALFLGALPPVVINLVYLSGGLPVDVTPLGFLVTLLLYVFAVIKYRLGDVTPIARRRIIDNVRDGVVVVDVDDRILDVNPAALEMTGVDESIIGHSVPEMLAALPELHGAYREMTETLAASERTVTYSDRFFEIEATPIEDDRGRHVGWTLLLQDVTDRVRRERDLEEQIERLDRFARVVSHDLRNPINVAGGYIQQVQETGDLEQLDKSLEALDRMEAIIEDVMTLTRQGGSITEPTVVSLETVAREAWQTVETGEATLQVESAHVVADADQFRRLLENLFTNSIEHGIEDPDGTDGFGADHTVSIGTEAGEGSDVTLYVEDDGVGIDPERREQVFEEGFTTGGTGLGLTIVEQIARAHGWDVAVAESESGGARFEFHGVSSPVGTSR